MSEHVNMPVRRLKALNYEDEFQSKGGTESRVKLFSSEEMMERMMMKKRAQKQGLEDASDDEEIRKRREYQQQLFMLRDGSADDESDNGNQRDDMQEWLQSLHIKTQSIIDKCKPRAATQVATAAVRLKGKKLKSKADEQSTNQETSNDKTSVETAGNGEKIKSRTIAATHVATVAVRIKGKKTKSSTDDASLSENSATGKADSQDTTPDKSSSETDEAPVVKEPERKSNDDAKAERKAVHSVKASSSKQLGHHQKRDGKGRHHTQSFKHRTHRQKAQTTSHE